MTLLNLQRDCIARNVGDDCKDRCRPTIPCLFLLFALELVPVPVQALDSMHLETAGSLLLPLLLAVEVVEVK